MRDVNWHGVIGLYIWIFCILYIQVNHRAIVMRCVEHIWYIFQPDKFVVAEHSAKAGHCINVKDKCQDLAISIQHQLDTW